MRTKKAEGIYKLAALVRHQKINDGVESVRKLKPWDSYWDDFWEGYWENYWKGYWDNFWEGYWKENQF